MVHVFLSQSFCFNRVESSCLEWFETFVVHWYNIMTARSIQLAMRYLKRDKYKAAISHLKATKDLFLKIKCGDKGHWKPCQTGVIMSTTSYLNFHVTLLEKEGFQFVFGGRFTQDYLENLLSRNSN